jgi:hypothetical protein
VLAAESASEKDSHDKAIRAMEVWLKQTGREDRPVADSQLEGFAIRGADGQWAWADAKIDGDTVLVWSDKITAPTAVRYAWADNPTCNLYNAAGLPASPFRTDAVTH